MMTADDKRTLRRDLEVTLLEAVKSQEPEGAVNAITAYLMTQHIIADAATEQAIQLKRIADALEADAEAKGLLR